MYSPCANILALRVLSVKRGRREKEEEKEEKKGGREEKLREKGNCCIQETCMFIPSFPPSPLPSLFSLFSFLSQFLLPPPLFLSLSLPALLLPLTLSLPHLCPSTSPPSLLPFRRQEELEAKLVEEETAKRVEQLVAERVQQELERRKDEIEAEVLRRVEEAKKVGKVGEIVKNL